MPIASYRLQTKRVEEPVKATADMTVRVLDKDGAEIAGFYQRESVETEIPADLRKALKAFRAKYPESRYIDVEFALGE
jgi:hypothetical protein